MLYLKTALWEETQTCCYTIDFASHKGNWPKYLDTQHLQTNFFHTVATLKCAVQQKPNCMQRFFSAVWAGDSKVFLAPEVARVTFSDSVSAPVSNCLNPGPDPTILQIWESDSCSDSGYNHRSNRNLPMFLPKTWPHTPATAEMEKWLRVRFFTNFWLRVRIRVRKKNAESCRSRLR